MMMETTLYTYQYLYLQELVKSGKMGKIQFLRGSHYQDMSNWPDYWMGLPPMYYGTHAIAPMVGLSGSRIRKVHCFGSGTMEKWLKMCIRDRIMAIYADSNYKRFCLKNRSLSADHLA